MARPAGKIAVLKALASNPRILRARPRTLGFLCRYMKEFRIQRAGRNLILHSHLPPLNSRAYKRFIEEHLVARSEGPSHAQVGLTDRCPQNCAYCYNRGRKGAPMDTATILRVIRELRELGVFWLGFTGGEPLLNKDIVGITESASRDCAVKLFTTGCGLTPDLAAGLRDAGLFSVSVSLDHWEEEEHDRSRGYPGAFRTAMGAIETFRAAGGIQVGVSAVLSKDMCRPERIEAFLGFLEGLGIDEAWLSETKPSVPALWSDDLLITEEGRRGLTALQNRRNRRKGMTVNYLGHFEGAARFGCNAGRKMVYVDAFGEVGPCVFTPMTFGNVRDAPLREICAEMAGHFRPGCACFMNENYRLFRDRASLGLPLPRKQAVELMKAAQFGPPPIFERLIRG
jgi:MoaA/NifB/PqqE/SkfB family radical SAM enzyme